MTAEPGHKRPCYVAHDERFIDLPANGVKAVVFNGYCLDFALENLTAADSLNVQPVQSDLSDIASELLITPSPAP